MKRQSTIKEEKEIPGKLNESDLSIFEKKCETLEVMCDTLDLILTKDAEIMTEMQGNIVQ